MLRWRWNAVTCVDTNSRQGPAQRAGTLIADKLNTLELRQAYEVWHSRLESGAELSMPWHLLVRKHLDLARDVIGKRMLEIGCGRGEFVCWLASQGERPQRIVAADFASTAVSKAREFAGRNNLGGIEWEVGDIQAIAHPSDSFDTVISCETVEHVPDPRGAIRELARVLRRGGRLLLTTPNYMGPLGLYRMYLRLCGRVFTETGQPLNHFMMLPATRDWVARAGLHVTAVDAVGHYLPFPGRPPIELRALSRRGAWMRWLGLHSLIVAEKR